MSIIFGRLLAWNTQAVLRRYLWGPAVDQILAEETVDGGTADSVQWTLTDHLNTVRDIAKYDPGTDTTTVVNHLVYDAFGRVTSESNPAVDSLFLFTARPFDEDTGLQNNLNRWYDPAAGRWLSEDPISYSGGFNLHQYVFNSPTNRTDPTGKSVEVCCRKTHIGSVVDSGANAFGLRHCWIRTSNIEAGMGPAQGNLPEDAGKCPCFQTKVTDHSGEGSKKTAECYNIPNCDEGKVEKVLKIGCCTGKFGVFNNCHTLVMHVLMKANCHNTCYEWKWVYTVYPAGVGVGVWQKVCVKSDVPDLPPF